MDRRHFLKKIFLKIFYLFSAIILAHPAFSFITFKKSKKKTITFPLEEQRSGVTFKEGVFLIKEADELLVLSARCTHLGCLLQYEEFNQHFHCPCHGSVFDLKGQWLAGPAKKNLLRIPIRKEDTGEISVTIEL